MTEEPHAPGSSPAADPSMEDILASIRRILNEDEAAQPPHEETPSTAAAVSPMAAGTGGSGEDDGVFVLDEGMLVNKPMPVTHATPQADPLPGPVAVVAHAAPSPPPSLEPPVSGLLAPETAAAAAQSVGTLLRTLSSERSAQVYRGGPTIEDLVREELRPLLKDWLDQHLPPMVERLVRSEIERVTGRLAP